VEDNMNDNNEWSEEMRNVSEILFEIKADIAVIKTQFQLREKQHEDLTSAVKDLESKLKELEMLVAETRASAKVVSFVWKGLAGLLMLAATGAYIFMGGH